MTDYDGVDPPPVANSLDRYDDATESILMRIYLAVLQQSQPTRALLVAQGIPGGTVDRAVEILASRGLLNIRADRTWEVISPDISLPAHAVELERRARSARAAAHELAQVYFQARSGTRAPMEGVRVLQSMDEIHSVTADILSAARSTVVTMRDRSPRTRELFTAPVSAHREPSVSADGAQLQARSTYDVSVLDIEGAGDVLLARAQGGERARFVDGLPFSAVVIDDTAALVDVTTYDESGQGSLLVRSRPLVLGLQAMVEAVWRLGVPMDRVDKAGLDRRDMRILALLAAGASDATIARQSKISQRTVERRVRAVMERLGAGTRFQAGVQAARRGWL